MLRLRSRFYEHKIFLRIGWFPPKTKRLILVRLLVHIDTKPKRKCIIGVFPVSDTNGEDNTDLRLTITLIFITILFIVTTTPTVIYHIRKFSHCIKKFHYLLVYTSFLVSFCFSEVLILFYAVVINSFL